MRVMLCDFCHARLVLKGDTVPQGNGVNGYSQGKCHGCENETTVHSVAVLDSQHFSFLKSAQHGVEPTGEEVAARHTGS